jgi:hypothetical protein
MVLLRGFCSCPCRWALCMLSLVGFLFFLTSVCMVPPVFVHTLGRPKRAGAMIFSTPLFLRPSRPLAPRSPLHVHHPCSDDCGGRSGVGAQGEVLQGQVHVAVQVPRVHWAHDRHGHRHLFRCHGAGGTPAPRHRLRWVGTGLLPHTSPYSFLPKPLPSHTQCAHALSIPHAVRMVCHPSRAVLEE